MRSEGKGTFSITFIQSTPTGYKCSASDKVFVTFGHTNGNDVRLEINRFVETKQGQIVLERAMVELWMRCNNLNASFLVAVRFFLFGQIIFAQT